MKKIILLTGLLSIPVLAATEPPQFFVGGKGGYQWAQDDTYNHSNPKGKILGIYSGLQFTPSWSWDVGYQYHDELRADATSVNVKTWLIESALRYDWYLQDNLSLYSRLGAAYWDMEKKQLSSDKFNATGFSPIGEVGVSYTFTPGLSTSVSYQYIDSLGKSNTGKYDSHAALISFAYAFGHTAQSAPVETAPVVEAPSTSGEEVIVGSESFPQTWTFAADTTKSTFDFDSDELRHGFTKPLTQIASILNRYPQAKAVISGYTDSTGSESYNQQLSERRAQSAVHELIKLGVTPAQIEWLGEGKHQPIADNNTVEGRAINRRVEITIPTFNVPE